MNKIKISAATMTVAEKLQRGQLVIDKSTDNPNVPGNAELVARLVALQTELESAEMQAMTARALAKAATARLHTTELAWRDALTRLAAFTESATGGDPVMLLDAGFDVRSAATPIHEPPIVETVTVRLAGGPGHSHLTWERQRHARGYIVQGSPDVADDSKWVEAGIFTKSSCRANGALPGQPYWYRVSAFNAAGQGPWSMPAPRPVM